MAWTRKKTRGGKTVFLGCYRDATGRERTKQFVRKRDALDWANERELEVRRGDAPPPLADTVTVAEFAPTWLATKLNITPKTRQGYIDQLHANVLPRWGDVPLSAIDWSDVQAWVADLAATGGASRTRQAHQVLHAMLSLAVKRRLIRANPAAEVEKPGQGRGKNPPRWLDADEIDRLAAAAAAVQEEPQWGVWVLVTTYAGLRWSESVALRRRHIDLPRRRIEVYDDAVEVSGRLEWGDAKTQGPVVIPAWVVALLAAHLDTRVGPDRDALVFTAPRGGPLRYRRFRDRTFDRAVIACGWTPRRNGGVTPHALRHSCASILINAGAPPKQVQEHMRHSSIDITFDIYGHLFDGAVADTWAKIDELRGIGGGVVDLERHRRDRAVNGR